METQPEAEEHFFQVTLSQEGSDYLLKLFRLMKWMIAVMLLLSLLFLVQTYIRWLLNKDFDFGIASGHTQQFNQSFRYLVIHAVLTLAMVILQVIFTAFELYMGIFVLNNIRGAS